MLIAVPLFTDTSLQRPQVSYLRQPARQIFGEFRFHPFRVLIRIVFVGVFSHRYRRCRLQQVRQGPRRPPRIQPSIHLLRRRYAGDFQFREIDLSSIFRDDVSSATSGLFGHSSDGFRGLRPLRPRPAARRSGATRPLIRRVGSSSSAPSMGSSAGSLCCPLRACQGPIEGCRARCGFNRLRRASDYLRKDSPGRRITSAGPASSSSSGSLTPTPCC